VNFIIELKVITSGCASMKHERLVVADTKDEAYDKFFSSSTIRSAMHKTETFSVSLRQIEEVQ
jgi:hypothetical protein